MGVRAIKEMLMKILVPVLALVLVASLLSQDTRKEREESPKQIFERAAFAEEHDRDFKKAIDLYKEAGSIAQFLGDQQTADEAMKAWKRVEARAGQGVETAPSSEIPPAVQRRLYLLV